MRLRGVATMLSILCIARAGAQSPPSPAGPLSREQASELSCFIATIPELKMLFKGQAKPTVMIDRVFVDSLVTPRNACSPSTIRPRWLNRMEFISPPTSSQLYGDRGKVGVLRVVLRKAPA